MARLNTELQATVNLGGEKVGLFFRSPANEELNGFLATRYETGKKGRLKDNSLAARVVFFDLLLMKVENLQDKEGVAITPERKDLIPATWKNDIVFRLFEEVDVEIKN